MENLFSIVAVVLVGVFVCYMAFVKTIPAGYHEKNSDGSYSPMQTTLWNVLISK